MLKSKWLIMMAIVWGVAVWSWQMGAQEAQPLYEDWTQKLGTDKIDGTAGMVFADINEDGWPDLVFGSWTFYINEKGEKLTLLKPQEGLVHQDKNIRPHGSGFGDVNNDGHLDMFVPFMNDSKRPEWKDIGRRNEIWFGDGKGNFTFKKDTGLSTAPQPTSSNCLFDYDGDGNLDLFVGNWIEGDGAADSFLYKGKGDGTFQDVTEKAGLKLENSMGTRKSHRPIFSVTSTDYNNDGLQDLMVGTYAGIWNLLYKNNGDGTFTDVGYDTQFDCDHAGRSFAVGSPDTQFINICTFSLPVADFNCDGNMDVFVSTIRHWDQRIYDPSNMLVNLGKEQNYKFQHDQLRIPRWPAKIGKENWGDLHSTWLDVDNDGWEDLIIASSDYPDEQLLKLYHQIPDGKGQFEDWTGRLGFRWVQASNVSLGDFDRDGATDIVVGRQHMRLTPEQQAKYPLISGLFHNIEPKRNGNGFFNLRLKGQDVGARVTIWTGNHQQIREVYSSLGIGGQRNDTDCRFGVGKAKSIDKVEIRWPDKQNTVQVFKDVPPNKFYTVSKGEKKLTELKFQ